MLIFSFTILTENINMVKDYLASTAFFGFLAAESLKIKLGQYPKLSFENIWRSQVQLGNES
jgi:hypothetical protein